MKSVKDGSIHELEEEYHALKDFVNFTKNNSILIK